MTLPSTKLPGVTCHETVAIRPTKYSEISHYSSEFGFVKV